MRHFIFVFVLSLFFSQTSLATWQKINDVDYIWGPFKIYNISLFSETGDYSDKTRPLMLALKYAKPVDGRDFAISLARSWSNLGITLKDQDEVVDRLRKILPNIKKDDVLSYIALEDKGYFVLNDTVIPEEFNKEFSDAVVSVWLDPRVEIGRRLLKKKQQERIYVVNTPQVIDSSKTDKSMSQSSVLEPTITNKENDNSIDIMRGADEIKSDDNLQGKTEISTESKKIEIRDKEEPKGEQKRDDFEIEITPESDPIPVNTLPII